VRTTSRNAASDRRNWYDGVDSPLAPRGAEWPRADRGIGGRGWPGTFWLLARSGPLMATARELLEQADALMRRNRERAADDIPVLTDAVPAGDLPGSRASPLSPPPPVPEPQTPESSTTEPSTPEPSMREPSMREPSTTEPSTTEPSTLEDVPLLTDAVEEIEAVSILETVESEGEPSDWLDLGRNEVSVVGDAPDSIAIVPSVSYRSPAAAPGEGEFAQTRGVQTAPTATPEPAAMAPVSGSDDASFLAAPVVPLVDKAAALMHGTGAPPTADALPQSDLHLSSMMTPPVESTTDRDEWLAVQWLREQAGEPVALHPAAPGADAAPPETPPEMPPETPPEWPLPESAAGPIASTTPEAAADAAAEVALPVVAAVPPVAAAAPPAPAPDAVQWDALAEEIRMQVLQRIDIFTDTGMHEQLAARLQPIVDRASADLVTTINQHVGQLLRAYVAEAIEREIEKWREGNP
jgi:hypothetical protein